MKLEGKDKISSEKVDVSPSFERRGPLFRSRISQAVTDRGLRLTEKLPLGSLC